MSEVAPSNGFAAALYALAQCNDATPAAKWLAALLPQASRVTLWPKDLARIDAWHGSARDLQDMMPALPRLSRAIFYEADIVAKGGTRMMMGYGAVQRATGHGIDVGWACWMPDEQRIIGPLGPAGVAANGVTMPGGLSPESERELRSACGIVVRALLMRVGNDRLRVERSALLRRIGPALWGDAWHGDMARALTVRRDTVDAWASGKTAVPDGVMADLAKLVRERRDALDGLIAETTGRAKTKSPDA